jgi:methionyl-tRNA synthetase
MTDAQETTQNTKPAETTAPAAQTTTAAPAPAVEKAITIDDFAKIEMKIGKVLEAAPVEGSEKLLKLSVDFGEATPRTVFSGIAKYVTVDDLVGNIFPFVTNLPPRKMMGSESQAMILAVNDDVNFALLKPSAEIKPGTQLK